MTIHTLTATSQTKHENKLNFHDAHTSELNVVNIRSARKAQIKAQQELMDYMMWTMKHDMDPHRIYDDPVEIFRKEMKATLSVA